MNKNSAKTILKRVEFGIKSSIISYLIMEAANIPETLVNFYKTHGARQKTVVFIKLECLVLYYVLAVISP